MTDGCAPLLNHEGKTVGHICRGTNRRFWAVVRQHGHRKWRRVGPMRKSYEPALRDLTREFASDVWKRGHVLFAADYYDPESVTEIKR